MVVPECQHKTGEMCGGREEVWPRESTYEEDAWPGMSVYEGSDGKARSGKEERVGTDPTGRRSGRRVKRGPVNRVRTEGSRQDRDCLIDSLPADYGYGGNR